jgi:hypothetical protein
MSQSQSSLLRASIVVAVMVLLAGCDKPEENDAGVQAASTGSLSPSNEQVIPPATTPRQREPSPLVFTAVESIPPYILELGGDYVTLCWLTEEKLVGSVRLFSYSKEADHAEQGAASHYHRVAIKGLKPATTYRYEIGLNYRGSFRTADSASSFEVAVFGHPGGTETPLEFPTELLAGRLLDIDPEIVLCTGDLAMSATARSMRDTFFHRFGRFMKSKPIYVSPSNHDGRHNGQDYTEFRKLFPYNFDLPTGGSHWFDYKNARFYALTYKLKSPELFRQHVEWLCKAIDESDQEFNIVFLGGQDPTYYDKSFLFRSLSTRPVELVLGGDGGAVLLEKHHGLDFYFSGDGSMGPYPFFYLRFFDHHFDVQTQYAGPRAAKIYRSFYSKKPRRIVTELASHQVESEPHILHFKKLAASSKVVAGVKLDIDWRFDESVEIELRWKAKDRGGFTKMQSHWVKAKTKSSILIHLPLVHPADTPGEPFDFDEVRITLAPHRAYFKKYPLQEVTSNASLFAR